MGKWVTIKGAHVYIEDDGSVTKGPKDFIKKVKTTNTVTHISTDGTVAKNSKVYVNKRLGKNKTGETPSGKKQIENWKLQEENKQLKDSWNKLKDSIDLELTKCPDNQVLTYMTIKNKIEELEQRNHINE